MDFWVAIISGGAAVLGAGVGGAVAALPAFRAEARALHAEHRRELRTSLLRVLEAMRDTHRAVGRGDEAVVLSSGAEYLRELAVLGTLIGKRDRVVIEYLAVVMSAVFKGHPRTGAAISEATVYLPSWYRGASSRREIRAQFKEWQLVIDGDPKDASA